MTWYWIVHGHEQLSNIWLFLYWAIRRWHDILDIPHQEKPENGTNLKKCPPSGTKYERKDPDLGKDTTPNMRRFVALVKTMGWGVFYKHGATPRLEMPQDVSALERLTFQPEYQTGSGRMIEILSKVLPKGGWFSAKVNVLAVSNSKN